MKINLLLFWVLLIIPLHSFSQSVQGYIKSADGKMLEGVSVQAVLCRQELIRHFAISDKKGEFELSVTHPTDSLCIVFSHIQYEKKIIAFKDWKQRDTIILAAQKTIELPTVVIEQKPYIKNGDTITFNISAFDQKNLRSIGDVINNIPGFETGSNGMISYQGKPLSNYYIENLDLLGGRYPLANGQLPKEMVSQIQVYLKHQPIRILDSLSKPNNVAVNLKLKENAKGKVLPSLRSATGANTEGPVADINLLITYFSRKFQALNNMHYNNAGKLKGEELNGVTIGGNLFLQHFSGWNNPVTINEAMPPPMGSKIYSFNQSGAADVHVLKKTGEYGTLKINSGYVQENNRQTTSVITSIFTGTDTLQILEKNRVFSRFHALTTGLNYTYNAPKLYYTAELVYTGRIVADKDAEITGAFQNLQRLSAPENELQFKANGYKTIKKWIVNGGALIVSSTTRSQLAITPGIFPEFFNQGIHYKSFDYNLRFSNFITKSIFSARRKIGKTEAGTSLTSESNLYSFARTGIIETATGQQEAIGFSSNKANMQQHKITLTPEWKIPLKKWFFELIVPLSYLNNQFNNQNRQQSFNGYFIQPAGSIGFKLNNQHYFSGALKAENEFGGFFSRVPFWMLSNFRSISTGIDSMLPIQRNIILETGYEYKSQLEDFNVRMNYRTGWQYFNYNNAFSFNGFLQTSNIVAAANRAFEQKADIQSMKIISNWQTTLKFKIQLADYKFMQLQNFTNTQFRVAQAGGSFNLTVRRIKNTVLSLKSEHQNIYTAQGNLKLENNTSISSGDFSITLFLKKRKWAIENSHRAMQINGQSNASFYQPNITISYFAKKQTFELAATNLNNRKTFYTVNAFQNIILQSAYQLRPFEVVLKYSLRF